MRLLGFVLSVFLFAASADALEIQLESAKLVSSEKTIHVFGDQNIKLKVLGLQAVEDTKIKGRLFQKSYSLRKPVTESFLIEETQFLLALPSVERVSSFELVVFSEENDKGKLHELGQKVLKVYPKDLFMEVRRWSENNQLLLLGDSQELVKFFTDFKISFSRYAGEDISSKQKLIIHVGDLGEEGKGELFNDKGPGIVLREDVPVLPKITVHPRLSGAWVDVEMKILESLEGSPRHQQVLLEIFRFALGNATGN